jgi:hypothetical protein
MEETDRFRLISLLRAHFKKELRRDKIGTKDFIYMSETDLENLIKIYTADYELIQSEIAKLKR